MSTHVSGLRCTAVLLFFFSMVFSIAVQGAAPPNKEVLIRFTSTADENDKKLLLKEFNVQQVKSVPMLNATRWTLPESTSLDDVTKRLSTSPGISVVDAVPVDYRRLFVAVPPTGDLLSGVQKALADLREKPQNADVQLVRIRKPEFAHRMLTTGFGVMEGYKQSGSLTLNLTPNVTTVAVRRRYDMVGESGTTYNWVGDVFRSVKGMESADVAPAGTASLTVKDDSILGRVVVDNEVYTISPLGGGLHAIVKVNTTKLPPEHPPSHWKRPEPRSWNPEAANVMKSSKADALPSAPSTGPTKITVGIAFTSAAASGIQNLTLFADSLVGLTNTSFKDSGVNVVLSLAGTQVFNYADTNMEQDLERLVAPTDGMLDDAHLWRKNIKANLIVLVTTAKDACGLAKDILAKRETAFAVVNVDCAISNLSFPHELGHLFGARHDPVADPEAKPFPYGHGYIYQAKWRTVMAYDKCNGCPRLPNWSSPRIKKLGIAMGTAGTHDNARVLNEAAKDVAAFVP